MNDDINIRIQKLMNEKYLNAAQFADEIGVQRSSISHILSGRNKPSIDFIHKLLYRFKDVDAYWLITGTSIPNIKNSELENNSSVRVSVVKSNINSLQPSLFGNEENVNPVNNAVLPKKKVEKIVTFYSDKTFEEHYPI